MNENIAILLFIVCLCTLLGCIFKILIMFMDNTYNDVKNATKAKIVKKTRKDGQLLYDVRINGYWKLPFWWHTPYQMRDLTKEKATDIVKQMVSERQNIDNATIVQEEITNNVKLN